MKFITVSGIDKSGKSSIIAEFMTQTFWEHYVVDRDPSNYHGLNYIQDRIRSKSNQLKLYEEFKDKLKHIVDLAIFVKCDPKVIEKRFIEHNEQPLVGKYSIEEHQKILENCFDEFNYPNSIKIDTTEMSVYQSVRMIQFKLREIEKNANQ